MKMHMVKFCGALGTNAIILYSVRGLDVWFK